MKGIKILLKAMLYSLSVVLLILIMLLISELLFKIPLFKEGFQNFFGVIVRDNLFDLHTLKMIIIAYVLNIIYWTTVLLLRNKRKTYYGKDKDRLWKRYYLF